MFVINELLEDIFESSSLMPRIATKPEPEMPTENKNVDDEDEVERDEEDILRKHQKAVLENESYIGEMRTDGLLEELRMSVVDRTRVIMEEAIIYKDKFEQYSYLWTENRSEYMKQFLQVKENEDGEVVESTESQPIQLEKFESEIRKFEGIHKTVMAVDPDVLFHHWFKVDARPIKQSLNLVVKKWSYTLTKHLSDDVVGSLSKFIFW
jgi:dynein heavy chain